MHVSELETPALLIDLDIMERNLRSVGDYVKAHGLRLRPHTKTHKVPAIGRMQLESGAVGLTVAKVGEAEVMVESGTPDMLVHYPVIGRSKLERLMAVARQTRVTVALDSLAAARQLSDAARAAQVEAGILAEVDVGLGRVGVMPGEELIQLAQCVGRLPNVTFEGITFYPGHIKDVTGEGAPQMAELGRLIQSMLQDFERAGIAVNVVSGGSTPSLFHTHELAGLTEIRPGTYVYNDINTVNTGGCTLEDCAATMLVTVVSTAHKGRIIIDGGTKTFSSDRLIAGPTTTFGRVTEAPGAVFFNMNEEHGYVETTAAGREFAVGDRLHVIPNHICAAVNLHERVYGIRKEQVEKVWEVKGRGKLQ